MCTKKIFQIAIDRNREGNSETPFYDLLIRAVMKILKIPFVHLCQLFKISSNSFNVAIGYKHG